MTILSFDLPSEGEDGAALIIPFSGQRSGVARIVVKCRCTEETRGALNVYALDAAGLGAYRAGPFSAFNDALATSIDSYAHRFAVADLPRQWWLVLENFTPYRAVGTYTVEQMLRLVS